MWLLDEQWTMEERVAEKKWWQERMSVDVPVGGAGGPMARNNRNLRLREYISYFVCAKSLSAVRHVLRVLYIASAFL